MADPADDLIDYEEDDVALLSTAPLSSKKTAPSKEPSSKKEDTKEVKKGSYVGIHSTGFRDFLLKPELLRAINDCGFEHPSEGTC